MEKDFDNQKNNNPKHFGLKHKIAALIIIPLFIATFLSIVSLRAEIYSRPQNLKFKQIIAKIVKIFDLHSVHKPTLNSVKLKMAPIEAAIDSYLLNTHQYPVTLNDLITDPGIQGWRGPYLKPSQMDDPWDKLFIYIPNSKDKYKLISYGADGVPGGKGENADIYDD